MLVVAGTFDVPPPGSAVPEQLAPHCTQLPVPLADVYNGVPGASSLKWEGQGGFGRPGTDIYLSGHACAVGGHPVTSVTVNVRIGACSRDAVVFGDRRWRRGVVETIASAPVPFERLPLTYERSFGGFVDEGSARDRKAADRNPVGLGLYTGGPAARDRALPNIEDPRALIGSSHDRPLPIGFGPVARSWMPRRSLAGSFTTEWVAERAPLWPRDVDPNFFVAASPGLHATPRLTGGEAVELVGLHPDGVMRFALPTHRLVARFDAAGRSLRRQLVLDTIMFDTDALTVTLIWRASVVAVPGVLSVHAVVVRELEDWESAP